MEKQMDAARHSGMAPSLAHASAGAALTRSSHVATKSYARSATEAGQFELVNIDSVKAVTDIAF
jgi:hypothetical protein